MLKLNAGLSRKIGLPNYGSRGAMVNVEIELPADVLKDPEKLRRQVRGCFETLRAAVDEELGVTPQSCNDVQEQRWRPSADPRRNGRDNEHAADGNGGPPATEKQVRALHASARRAGVGLADELRERFGVVTADVLTRRQASEAIDGLKSRVGD
ncbi:hypothetical protein [Alienimonas chondri]|uniref:Uncharacterized protein n=1 Tax=Alienimonas chondri TaxID=2681879 RepID=A0ABX1VA02_9PLAN|nr:hypothetical protein [Alienimonas chondri]NNJ24335.1 hypothetical protein [Alienimonas chondri]